jgi:hypothetical protein
LAEVFPILFFTVVRSYPDLSAWGIRYHVYPTGDGIPQLIAERFVCKRRIKFPGTGVSLREQSFYYEFTHLGQTLDGN